MSTITIEQLHPAGTTFFSESESFIDDLKDDVLINTKGGDSGSPLYTEILVVIIRTVIAV